MDLILHPVILKYIDTMSEKFARKVNVNIFLCFLFTILWTAGIVAYDIHRNFHVIDGHAYTKLTFTILAQLLTFYFIFLVSFTFVLQLPIFPDFSSHNLLDFTLPFHL